MGRWVEFHVKVVDRFGDAVESQIWDTLRDARADYAGIVVGTDSAKVLEKVTRFESDGFRSVADDRFEVVAESGSPAALSAWRGEAQ